MTKIINSLKLSSRFMTRVGFAFVVVMVMIVGVPQAKAESPNILVGADLTIGSTGQGVAVLQGLMSELGFLQIPMGVPKGYYGELTKAAVARYQASRLVTPSVGYFGPLSKISMHQQFASTGWLTMLGW